MKILIDIQEETYNKMRRGEALYPADANVAIFAIETGTPLEECDDCISRRAVLERAINAPIAKVVTEDKVIYRKIIFADDVEKLSPVTPQPCDDAISRQAAIDACLNGWNKDYKEIVKEIRALPPVTAEKPNKRNKSEARRWKRRYLDLKQRIFKLEEQTRWIPVSERLPELNRPLLVTAYHRVYYGHLISESGNYGYPIFRIHGLGDKNRDWVQETMSHEPYSLGRIDAWMYFDIPEPYKASPAGEEVRE